MIEQHIFFFIKEYIVDIRYVLYIKEDVLFDHRYISKYYEESVIETGLVSNNIQRTLSDNINQLLEDSLFLSAVSQNCR